MPGTKLLGIATALALLGALAGESHAGAKEDAEKLAERGRLLFLDGNYTEALKRYRAAYTIYAHPAYLFNQGRAAEALGECSMALEAYKNYVAKPGDSEEDKQALDHARSEIERLDKKCGKGAQLIKTAGDGSSAGAGNGGATSNGTTPPGLTGGSDLTKTSSPGSSRDGFRVATYIAGGVTVGLLGYYLYEASRLGAFGGNGHYSDRVIEQNDATPMPITGDDICASDMINGPGFEGVKDACDAGDAAVLRANITLGIAGVATAATLVFAYFGFIHDFGPAGDAGSVALIPTGPGDVGMSALVRF